MKRYTVSDLLTLMQRLRHPEHGCPWDLKQTFETIACYTLEEAYEVVDAINDKDYLHLKEELGDLLLQVIFHAQMANEAVLFDFDDVVHTLVEKLVRRHPHVFPEGDLYADPAASKTVSAEDVKTIWEQVKQKEKAERQENILSKGVLGSVTRALPALKRAQKLQESAAYYGFDWPNIEPVFDKLREEIDELELAYKQSDVTEIQAEFGDVMFSMVALGRHLSLDAEQSLDAGNAKFSQRFAYIEQAVTAQGKLLERCSFAALDALWDEAKDSGL